MPKVSTHCKNTAAPLFIVIDNSGVLVFEGGILIYPTGVRCHHRMVGLTFERNLRGAEIVVGTGIYRESCVGLRFAHVRGNGN